MATGRPSELEALVDGAIGVSSVDTSRNPSLLAREQLAWAINCSLRGAMISQRPVWMKRTLAFSDDATSQRFRALNFQEGNVLDRPASDSFVMGMIGGRLFKVDVANGYRVEEVPVSTMKSVRILEEFAVPAIGANVQISVFSTDAIDPVFPSLLINGAQYDLVSIDGATLLTVTNRTADSLITTISAGFTMPGIGATVAVTVVDSTGFEADENVHVATAGFFNVVTIDSPTQVTLRNDGNAANAAPATLIASPQNVVNVVVANSELEFTVIEPNPARIQQMYSVQAEQYFVVQDGESRPIIYDGVTARRSGPDEIPVGTVMAYGNGRLWVALPDRSQFVAGDLLGSPTGILKFTEATYLSELGAFFVPLTLGKITAMAFSAVPDTSLGQGPLLVFTDRVVVTVNLPFDRTLWATLTQPAITIGLPSGGCMSGWGVANVNADPFFRARDGVRSFIQARREFGSGWGNTPVSTEMARILDYDTESFLNFASAVYFDNRFLCTVSPAFQPVSDRPAQFYHRGLIALDCDLISTIGQKLPPVWQGIWTKFPLLKIFKGIFNGVERCFAFGLSADGENELWELLPSSDIAMFDNGTERIQSIIELASFAFRAPYTLKKLVTGEWWYDSMVGTVDFVAYYRADQYPLFVPWNTWSESAPVEQCLDGATCATICPPRAQYRTRRRMPTPDDACDAFDVRINAGYEFQARLEWTGRARIRKFLLQATVEQEDVSGATCGTQTAGTTICGCLPQDFPPPSSGGGGNGDDDDEDGELPHEINSCGEWEGHPAEDGTFGEFIHAVLATPGGASEQFVTIYTGSTSSQIPWENLSQEQLDNHIAFALERLSAYVARVNPERTIVRVDRLVFCYSAGTLTGYPFTLAAAGLEYSSSPNTLFAEGWYLTVVYVYTT